MLRPQRNDQQRRTAAPSRGALFVGGLLAHLAPFLLYLLIASGLTDVAGVITSLLVYWPIFVGMAVVAAMQGALWARIPAAGPFLLA